MKQLICTTFMVFLLLCTTHAQTPELVKDICNGPCGSSIQSYFPSPGGVGPNRDYYPTFIEYNDMVYFVASDSIHGFELWKTDGSAAGTQIVKDINPGTAPAFFTNFRIPELFIINSKLLFTAYDGVHGNQYWVSDGTADSTYLLFDASGEASLQFQGQSCVINDALFETVLLNGNKVIKYDGTVSGSGIFALPTIEFYDATVSTTDNSKGILRGFLSGISGIQHFITDGTEANTTLIPFYDWGFTLSNLPIFTIPYNEDFLLFNSTASGMGMTDGTEAGTVILSDSIVVRPTPLFNEPLNVRWNNKLYFSGGNSTNDNPITREELYVTDGTPEGTHRVKMIRKGLGKASPRYLTVFQDQLFFSATDTLENRELWVTDGTEAGTQVFMELFPGLEGSHPAELTVAGNKMFFVATDPDHGRELWITDGTPQGTSVIDIYPGPTSSNPHNLFKAGDLLYFFAFADSALGYELYKIDLTDITNEVEEQEKLQADAVHVYPNPAGGKIHIQLESPSPAGIQKATLTDMSGKTVLQQDFGNTVNSSETLSIEHLSNGMYILKIITTEQKAFKQKIVVFNE